MLRPGPAPGPGAALLLPEPAHPQAPLLATEVVVEGALGAAAGVGGAAGVVAGAGAGARVAAASAALESGRRLLLAARAGDTPAVRALLAAGAPFTADWLGTSPLHLAAANNHLETVEVLLRAGVSRDARTKVERTPLHLAASAGHAPVAALLLGHGANVDCRDMLGMTPLHWAAQRGHADAARVLLSHGADAGAVSKFRKTPLALAAREPALLALFHAELAARAARDPPETAPQLSPLQPKQYRAQKQAGVFLAYRRRVQVPREPALLALFHAELAARAARDPPETAPQLSPLQPKQYRAQKQAGVFLAYRRRVQVPREPALLALFHAELAARAARDPPETAPQLSPLQPKQYRAQKQAGVFLAYRRRVQFPREPALLALFHAELAARAARDPPETAPQLSPLQPKQYRAQKQAGVFLAYRRRVQVPREPALLALFHAELAARAARDPPETAPQLSPLQPKQYRAQKQAGVFLAYRRRVQVPREPALLALFHAELAARAARDPPETAPQLSPLQPKQYRAQKQAGVFLAYRRRVQVPREPALLALFHAELAARAARDPPETAPQLSPLQPKQYRAQKQAGVFLAYRRRVQVPREPALLALFHAELAARAARDPPETAPQLSPLQPKQYRAQKQAGVFLAYRRRVQVPREPALLALFHAELAARAARDPPETAPQLSPLQPKQYRAQKQAGVFLAYRRRVQVPREPALLALFHAELAARAARDPPETAPQLSPLQPKQYRAQKQAGVFLAYRRRVQVPREPALLALFHAELAARAARDPPETAPQLSPLQPKQYRAQKQAGVFLAYRRRVQVPREPALLALFHAELAARAARDPPETAPQLSPLQPKQYRAQKQAEQATEQITNITFETTKLRKTPEKKPIKVKLINTSSPKSEPKISSKTESVTGAGIGGAASASETAALLLQRHGITLLPHDTGSTVLSALQSGRTCVLSDAGKLMLKESQSLAASGIAGTGSTTAGGKTLSPGDPGVPATLPAPSPAKVLKKIDPTQFQKVKLIQMAEGIGGGGGGGGGMSSLKPVRLKLRTRGAGGGAGGGGSGSGGVRLLLERASLQRLLAPTAAPAVSRDIAEPQTKRKSSSEEESSDPSEVAILRAQLAAARATIADLRRQLQAARANPH